MKYEVANRWKKVSDSEKKQVIVVTINDGNSETTTSFFTTIRAKNEKKIPLSMVKDIERLKRNIEKAISETETLHSVSTIDEAKTLLKKFIPTITHPMKQPKIIEKAVKVEKPLLTIKELFTKKQLHKGTVEGRAKMYETVVSIISNIYPDKDISTYTVDDVENIKIFIQKKGKSVNYTQTLLKIVASLFNFAFKKELIKKKIITDGYSSKFREGYREVLSNTDVEKIKAIPDGTLTKSMKRIKYMLLLQTETALGYGDLKTLKPENLIKHDEGFLCLKKERNKTGESVLIPLVDTAKDALTYLMETHPSDTYLFSSPTLTAYNIALRKIPSLAGIQKHVTSYSGRFFMANKVAGETVPEMVRKALFGNSKKIFDSTYVKNDPSKVFQLLQKL